jgi:phosphoesterase RecJ-like protein
MRVPEAIVERLRQCRHPVLTAHSNPEGDALGSALALALGLRAMGKRVQVVFRGGISRRYRVLPSVESVQKMVKPPVDLLVILDCQSRGRADLPQKWKQAKVPCLIIDHHPVPSNGEKVEDEVLAWIEPKAAATGEMVAALLKAMKVPMTKEIATCLYAAIITDTGVFRFRNTTPRVLRLAARLLSHGVDPQAMADQLVEARTFQATGLLARMLSKAEFDEHFGLCWSAISLRDFEQTGTTEEDTENFVNFLRAVDGARVAVLFREVERGLVKVSLRAKDDTDVSSVARQFGGGGHPAAAGCRLNGSLRKTVARVLTAVRSVLSFPHHPSDIAASPAAAKSNLSRRQKAEGEKPS